MRSLKSALGYQHAGSVIVVKLDGTASDVFLVDDLNLRKVESGDSYTYHGGTLQGRLSGSLFRQVDHGTSS